MNKKILPNHRIYVAGASGLAGSAICRSLKKYGYGHKDLGGELLKPSRKELDLSYSYAVQNWFKKNKPDFVFLLGCYKQILILALWLY